MIEKIMRISRTMPVKYVEFTLALLVGFLIHAASLYLVFPGYYDPFWPNHSDLYGPVAQAMAGDYLGLLMEPRPVGQVISALFGLAGIRGSIFLITCLVVVNAAGTAMLFRSFIPSLNKTKFLHFLIIGCIPYFFLVFSHPYQYSWAVYDSWATASYSLLLVAVILAIRKYSFILVFITVLSAFLVKETYVLSILLLASISYLVASNKDKPKLLRNLIGVIVAVIIAYLVNIQGKSVFISGGGVESPYYINFSFRSVFSEVLLYSTEGVSIVGWIYILFLMIIVLASHAKFGKTTFLIMAAPVAGLLALLPNSLLPNHHFSGYSWDAAYLIFSPVLVIVVFIVGRLTYGLAICLATVSFSQPFFLESRYHSNDWLMGQQIIQKRLLTSLSSFFEVVPPKGYGNILVTGLTMPFHPFVHGESLRSFHNLGNTKFSVVSYKNQLSPKINIFKTPKETNPVVFITPEQARILKFDEVWVFGVDGRIIKYSKKDFHNVLGIDYINYLLFPEVSEFLSVFSESFSEPDWYPLLQCGTILIDYNQPELATTCLTKSLAKNASNPYGYYYLGIAREMLGDLVTARGSFTRAVELDDKQASNPAFKLGLMRVLHEN